MGFFSKLFGGKSETVSKSSESCSIDICGDCFVINGTKFDIPVHIDALSAVLGKPRSKHFKTNAESDHVLEEISHEPISNRVNYTWDELGLMCYTHNGKVVNTFGICLQPQTNNSPSNPKSLYRGKLTINGKPWISEILAGEDCEVMRHAYVGNYLLTAEYTDFEQDDSTRNETSFTGIEINLP